MKTNVILRIFNALLFRKLLLVYSFFFFNAHLFAQCGTLINSFPYTEDFEASAAWTVGGVSSSWAWGTPAHAVISSAGGGTKSWCSGGLTGAAYNGSQQSWIMSPCFDFTGLNYPWVSFKIFWECENIWDGLVFQYTTNNGASWSNVGAAGDPVNCLNANWYNHNNISNLSTASPRHGWCGRTGATVGSCSGGNGSGAWITAKHCMSNLANQPNVRFRFLFGSGTTCNSYDGVAVDDILIQDAPPNVADFSYACAALNGASFINLSTQCPSSYAWNFGDPASGGSNTSSAQNPSHIFSAPGTYSVSLTTTGPCNAPSTTIIPVSIISLSTTVTNLTCNGANNGSSTVTAGGGTPAYSYTWLPAGGNASVATGLSAGNYTVLVADINNCVTNRLATITQPPAISVTLVETDVTCFGLANGMVTANASLGTAPYSYTWYPMGVVSQSINNLAPAMYSLTVKDAHGCSAMFTSLIKEPPPLVINTAPVNVSCFGLGNGHITALPAGGTPGYTYTWSPTVSNLPMLSNLVPGTYSIAVRDVNGCFVSTSTTITQPATPLGGSVLSSTPTCGSPNGSATVTATGGTPGYTNSWLPAGGNFSVAPGLAGGNYSATITDNNNCVATVTVFIAPSVPVTVGTFISHATCSYLADGNAFAIANGGIGPYTYTWQPNSVVGQGNPSLNGLAAGNYALSIQDVNNCIASTTFSISAPTPLVINYATTNVSCFGGNNGSISLTPAGGSPGYSFSCTTLGNVGTPITNLIAGNYSITLTDSHNCHENSVITITEPAILVSVINHTDIMCHGNSSGSVNATITGGTPGYTYLWAPTGGTGSSAAGLAAGVYSLVVQDTHNCTLISTVTLSQPALPLTGNALVNSVTCFGGNNGSATITPNGGTAGYAYVWDSSAITTSSAANLSSRSHNVTVTDLHNCSAIVTFFVNQPPQFIITPGVSKFCSGQPGTISATTNGTAFPIQYNWNGHVSMSSSIAVTFTATSHFNIFATDANGCVSSYESVLIEIPPPLQISTGFPIRVCEGQNTILHSVASGGDGTYSTVWQPGTLAGPTHTITHKPAIVYTVSVTDGCAVTESKTVGITFYSVPSSKISFEKKSGCAPVCVNFSNDSLLRSGLVKTYHWVVGDTTISDNKSPDYCFTRPGNHLVQLSYITYNGCVGLRTTDEFIHVDPKPVAEFTTSSSQFDTYNPTANFINQSKQAATYTWYFNNNEVSAEENPSHTFYSIGEQLIVLMAENEYGCKDEVVKKINITPEFTFFAPNSFTPNNDEVNDVFKPLGMGWNEAMFELNIFDRWGALIFTTRSTVEGWNGKTRAGHDVVQNDVYVWKVSMTDMFNRHRNFMGFVALEK